MTMLDRMRRHKSWLKWSLGIVCVAFVLLYVPSFLTPAGVGAAPSDVVASVDGRDITVQQYQQAYQQQVMQLQGAYGNQVNEQLLRQLGVPQQVVQQLIDEQAIVAEAERLGVSVNDGELQARIVRIPGFQENGQFIGEARYRQILASQRPPLLPGAFERQLRQALVSEKLQAAVTDWIQVSDADVEEAYRRQNERVKLDLAVFTADQYRDGIEPTDEELSAYFANHTEDYRVPEKRRVRYLSIDAETLRNTMTATPQEVDARYRQNIATYTTPEQIRARHILLSTEGADEAAVRAEAEGLLEQIRGGADFAALATEHSDDAASAVNGGDLDYFGRGAMVPEFETVAFSLEPGEVSDLVQTQYGFHIIRVEDRREAQTRPIDEVRAQLEDQIKFEKAQAEAQRIADDISGDVDTPADIDRVAAARGLAVGDSGLFARDEPLAGLGFAPTVAAAAFTLAEGEVSELLQTNTGFAFITVTEIAESHLPSLDDVRADVREDAITEQALARARERAASVASATGARFAAAARAAGVEVSTTDLIARGAVLPDVGMSTAVDDVVFDLERGAVSEAIEANDAIVVAHVTERGDIDPEAFEAARQGLRTQLLQERRNEFFTAYMSKAKQSMRILFNDNTIRMLLEGQ